MATRIYLRITQTHPGARTVTPNYNDALRAQGASSQVLTANPADEVAGDRPFRYLTNRYLSFSERVNAEFTLSGNITVSVRTGVVTAGSGFFKVNARVSKITQGGSDVETPIAEGLTTAAITDVDTTQTITLTPPVAVVLARNERFIVRLAAVPADGSQTFGSAEVPYIGFNNNDGSLSNSYAELTETVTLRDNGSKLWLRRTVANGIGNFFDMLETRGAVWAQSVVPTVPSGTLIQITRQTTAVYTEVAATINDTSNLSAYTSASFTPVVNRLYLLSVVHSDAATEATVPTISTTTGLAFVQVGASMPFNTIAAATNRITLFRAMKASGLSNGTYTVNFGDAGTGCLSQLVEYDNVLATGTDGANAIRNIVTNSANAGANPSITLAALQQSYHAIIGFFGTDIATAPTAGSGLALVGAAKTYATPTSGLFTVADSYAPGVTLNATLAASDWAGIGLEVVALPDTTLLEWVSQRLAEGFVSTAAANFGGSIYARESAATVNAGLRLEVLKREPDGTETLMYSRADGVEVSSSSYALKVISAGTWAGTIACHEDDRIVVRPYIVNVGTMAAGFAGVSYDGATPSVDGDSFLTLLDGPDFKDEADPARSMTVPSGLSTLGMGNGQ